MGFVSYNSAFVWLSILVSIPVLGVGFWLINRTTKGENPENINSWPNNLRMISTLAIVMILIFGSMSISYGAQQSEVEAQLKDHYGLELTAKEYSNLRYPGEEPQNDFKVFGSFDREVSKGSGSFKKEEIHLLWEDGEMKLAKSTDGESFSELQSAD